MWHNRIDDNSVQNFTQKSWMENITGARTWIRRHCNVKVWGVELRYSYRGATLCRLWPAQSYSKWMCFISVGLVVGLIVLVAALCLLALYFRKPANCKHFRSRVTSLFSVRHNGQFYYSRVSTHFQVRRDFISVRYCHLFHVLLIFDDWCCSRSFYYSRLVGLLASITDGLITCAQEPLVIGRRGTEKNLNGNTLAAVGWR
jgi:hypothetical protein